MDGKPVVCW